MQTNRQTDHFLSHMSSLIDRAFFCASIRLAFHSVPISQAKIKYSCVSFLLTKQVAASIRRFINICQRFAVYSLSRPIALITTAIYYVCVDSLVTHTTKKPSKLRIFRRLWWFVFLSSVQRILTTFVFSGLDNSLDFSRDNSMCVCQVAYTNCRSDQIVRVFLCICRS